MWKVVCDFSLGGEWVIERCKTEEDAKRAVHAWNYVYPKRPARIVKEAE